MSVMVNNRLRQFLLGGTIIPCANDCRHRPWGFVTLFLAAVMLSAGPVAANIPVETVAVITIDDDGRQLNYPHTVFYDGVEDEIYLVNGGTGRIVVYGSDFFPGMSIGASRGVEAPRGGVVQEDGDIYLLQVRNVKSERPRITVLNGAFFVEREMFFDEIPEAADFSPRQIAISRDGLIYVAGSASRGVLVLDDEGTFLRRLRPRDRTVRPVPDDEWDVAEAAAEKESIAILEAEQSVSAMSDIPEEFRPRRGRLQQSTPEQDGLNPVIVNHVTIDSSGRIYLLSVETSKVYVYGPDEIFLFSFGSKGGTPRHLSQPRAVAIDENLGLIYVADYMRHTVLVYSMEGEYLFEFGGRGSAPGWFNFPEDMTINKHGQVVIADLFNRRVQVLEVKYEQFAPVQQRLLKGTGAAARVLRSVPPIVEAQENQPVVEHQEGGQEAETQEAEPVMGPQTIEPVVVPESIPQEVQPPQVEDEATRTLREAEIEEIIIVDP